MRSPTQAELDAAISNAADWLLPNHDYGGQRFVDATEITRDNAGSLRPRRPNLFRKMTSQAQTRKRTSEPDVGYA